jgi:hypothetical protein
MKLSQRLGDLSERAKKAESAIESASNEARERVAEKREEFRTQAVAAADRVRTELDGAGVTAEQAFTAVKAKVAADLVRLKANMAEKQVELNTARLADRASRKETEANVALDFAAASIEDAKLAVIDAVLAKRDAAESRANG